jgi:hypothetical protein
MVALLAVETEGKGDLCSTNERGPTLIRYFFPALVALVSPVQNIFFLTVHNLCVPIAHQAGQTAALGHLSLSMRLWPGDTHSETGGRERLPAQLAGRGGHINCVR